MAEDPARIEAHIAEQREKIGENLDHLELHFETAIDWRNYIRKNPWWALGCGVITGFLLSSMFEPKHAAHGDTEVAREAIGLRQRIDRMFGAALHTASEGLENAVLDAFPSLKPRYRERTAKTG